MLWSFFLISGGTFVLIIIGPLIFLAIARFSYPEIAALLVKEKMDPVELADRVPWSLLATTLGVWFLVAAMVGAVIVRSVRFAETLHIGFLAILLFITQLQSSFGFSPELKWIPLTLMVLLPAGVILGANLLWPKSRLPDDMLEESPEWDSKNE